VPPLAVRKWRQWGTIRNGSCWRADGH